MKLLSHGERSDLREHLREVMSAAESPEERILFACHDLGKATKAWQTYIRNPHGTSPHHHAAAGGIFAALVLLELNRSETAAALAALHAGAAHHTWVQCLGTNFLGDLGRVAADQQAQQFALDPEYGIASFLPEVPVAALAEAWKQFYAISSPVSSKLQELNERFHALTTNQRLSAYLTCRFQLGKLCLADHASAARQSGRKEVELTPWRQAFPEVEFIPRPAKTFSGAASNIVALRKILRREFLKTARQDGTFYFIDAPTGLGKTEAMLEAAEVILTREKMQRIVYAVPQISIADQVFEEYFASAHAQIWNYRRREKSEVEQHPSETLRGNGSDSMALEAEQHPFAEPYNVTTFNQVLLAMCHPARNRCVQSLGLRDAVVVFDEFHKLPQVILPFFFRLAREYARQFHCRFILGSATPLEPFAFWDLRDSRRIPEETTRPLYQDKEIDSRRVYRPIGNLTAAELGGRIESFHQQHERDNLLVVVNLISEGSWELRRYFQFGFDPWRQLEALQTEETSRIIVFLDGLVPPMLRRKLITACRDAMTRRPVTLVSTQMIEVGVDLDFDAALIDFQGIASTIQRGGRVGRNGRGKPCEIQIFSLIADTKTGATSFDSLLEVRAKYDPRLKTKPFDTLFKKEECFVCQEKRFLKKWHESDGQTELRDSGLATELSRIQRKVYEGLDAKPALKNFFSVLTAGSDLGARYEQAQFIAELFDQEYGEPMLLIENEEIFTELSVLCGKIKSESSSAEDRRRLLELVADRTITPGWKVRKELESCLHCRGMIAYPEPVKVYALTALIL